MDNRDGTITDLNTGLMWEKKVAFDGTFASEVECADETGSCANPHNGNNTYSWAATFGGATYDGTVVTVFLEQLNDRCDQDASVPCAADSDCAVPGGDCGFAGHRDWRMPTIKELIDIVDFSVASPSLTVCPHCVTGSAFAAPGSSPTARIAGQLRRSVDRDL